MSKIIGRIISGILAAGIFVFYIISKKIYDADLKEVFKILYDATFICGVLFLCFAGLSFANSQGTFDGLKYGVKNLFHIHKPTRNYQKDESYGDYVTRSKENRKKEIPFNLWIGLAFAGLCIVFMIVYYNL